VCDEEGRPGDDTTGPAVAVGVDFEGAGAFTVDAEVGDRVSGAMVGGANEESSAP
jgi:hypothetical protein